MASVITTKHTLLQIAQNQGFALQPSASQIALVLTANSPLNILISDLEDAAGRLPTYLNFSAEGSFYVLWNGTNAAVPTATDLSGEAPELTPAFRKIGSISSFSVVSSTNLVVQIALFIGS